MEQELAQEGLKVLNTWTDSHDWFALLLCEVKED
jgi:uncharacterized SAM-dependent methyltransferase